jgi:hypothetical protein
LKQVYFYGACLVFLAMLMPAFVHADDNLDNLNAAYKAALERKELDRAADYICQAAKLDPGKYEKKCAGVQKAIAKELPQYDKLFLDGRTKFEKKDYVGGIRDLQKITFGPHHDEAQQLIQQATNLLNHLSQPADTGMQKLKQVQAAYESGDFPTASTVAASITDANILPYIKQIVTNIQIYNESMQEGDAYMQQGQYAAAKQKYSFALVIKNNGPGNPADKLQRITALLAAAEKPQVAESDSKSKTTPDPGTQGINNNGKPAAKSADNLVRIKEFLAKAQEDEAKGNTPAAISAYDQVLALDPQQQTAVAGKLRLMGATQKDSQDLEDALIKGVRSYGQSNFEEARADISLYLKQGGTKKGAAYFYLGASFMADAFLSDKNDYDKLQRNAVLNFRLAKGEHFKPAEKYISPKILAVWNQTSF